MEIIGKFRILYSFKVTGRGLVATGDILEGVVKVGSSVTINIGQENIILKIGGVEMMDNISMGEYWVGLTFVYNNDIQKENLQNLKLSEQFVDIVDE
jgi:hypothetical protein